jgi:hypothetical protein
MGILRLFRKGTDATPGLMRLPSGSFTVDASGKVVVSTLPVGFPQGKVKEISEVVLGMFETARAQQMGFSELVVQYAGLRLTARELRGGAIIFLAPRSIENR